MKMVDRFVLSSEDSTPAAFLVDHLYVAHGLRERLAWHVHRATRGRALARRTTMADLPATARAAVVPAVRGLPGAPAGASSWIVDTDYRGSARGRSVVFVFVEDARHPALIVKRARADVATGRRSLAREREALDTLHRTLPDRLAWTVPHVVSYEVTTEWESLAVTWLPGRSAYAEMHTRLAPALSAAAHFRSAAAWLARLHEATAVAGSAVQPPPFAGTGPEENWLARLREACARQPVRAVRSHGDFWARNVLLTRSGSVRVTGVVDWEQSSNAGSPFEDLFHFAATYGLNFPWSRYRRLDSLEALRRTFIEENRVSRAVRAYFRSYCHERGLDAGTLGSWFRCFLRAPAAQRILEGDVWSRFDEMLGSDGRCVFSG